MCLATQEKKEPVLIQGTYITIRIYMYVYVLAHVCMYVCMYVCAWRMELSLV